ncbi:unnamed protein product [Lepeophtheirus salmonis]|uniref:(salmon louse) hypothetical protein n=1 Tax=Lepeophtheirus salmonis TaxID=72036 RepID=A0A7R8HB47_LEPSM|nr:unnamed protein product [Lepeophtheirus salmonis]CAF2979725.1 unnamed protein product [Lepeophtheirus salmonis]
MNHSDLKVTETFVVLEDLPVKVQCFGKNLTENPKDLILLIPGNPGGVISIRNSVRSFMSLLRRSTIKKSAFGSSVTLAFTQAQRRVFPIIRLKLPYIDERFRFRWANSAKKSKTFKHIKNSPSNKDIHVKYLYGLFPVIERIMETPAGPMHSKMFTDFRYLILGLIYLLSFLPMFIQIIITSLLIPKESSKKICELEKRERVTYYVIVVL